MANIPLFSIIVLNYKTKEITEECINSIINSNFSDYEVILVDNNSKDKSLEYFKDKFDNSNIKIITTTKNKYFTGGNNFAAGKANGRYLFFLNSDCEIDYNCLSECKLFLEKHKKTLIQPKILWYKNKKIIDNVGGKYSIFGIAKALGRDEKDKGQYDKEIEFDYVNGTAFIIERNLFNKLNGFDEWFKYFYEDVDLCFRAKKLGYKYKCAFKAKAFHKGSLTFKKQNNEKEVFLNFRKNRIYLVWKNFKGFEKIKRLIIVIMFTFFLGINDLVSLKSSRYLINLMILKEIVMLSKAKRN